MVVNKCIKTLKHKHTHKHTHTQTHTQTHAQTNKHTHKHTHKHAKHTHAHARMEQWLIRKMKNGRRRRRENLTSRSGLPPPPTTSLLQGSVTLSFPLTVHSYHVITVTNIPAGFATVILVCEVFYPVLNARERYLSHIL